MKKWILLSLAVALMIAESCYGTKKPVSDWDQYFGAGVVPSYPYAARLVRTSSNDQHYRYTDSTGNTQSWHCSADESGAECAEGFGLYFYLVQADGGGYYVADERWGYGDPWDMTFEPDSIFTVMGRSNSDMPVFHFRFVQREGVDLACIQQPGTESIPNGKARKNYAKHHRLESCYQTKPQAIYPRDGWK